jgi:hypothetical protein
MQETAGNVLLKARILAELKRFDEAIQNAERAIVLQKAANPPRPTREVEKLIEGWRKLRP